MTTSRLVLCARLGQKPSQGGGAVSEGKELYVEHLRRTNPAEVVKARYAMTSSGFDGTKYVTTVSHLEIADQPGGLPKIRKRLLSRIEDNDWFRFLLDQTIDLRANPVAGQNPKLDVQVTAWDRINEKDREVALEPFMSFSQTSIRLVDHMLPVPGLVSNWQVTLGGDGTAADPRRRILELSLLDPAPDWLSPGLEQVRIHMHDADLRLLRTDQFFRNAGSRTITVSIELDGDTPVPVVEYRGSGADWTRVKFLQLRTTKLRPEQLTPDRVRNDSF